MNVASLELCKELYELSGWGKTYRNWVLDDSFHASHPEWDEWELSFHYIDGKSTPAYDLGYLLRRLPQYSGGMAFILAGSTPDGHDWKASYPHGNTHAFGLGKSPEDATAKLAIELFKQGILTKGDK